MPTFTPVPVRIRYTSSVFTAAGWRSVTIDAEALQVSPGMASVRRVVTIDDQSPARDMSRTGANRQRYNGTAIAAREVGTRKRLSACEVSPIDANP